MSDYCDATGASRLAERIQQYWRKKGFDVTLEMQEQGFVPAMRSGRTDVRSDMVNGMPRRPIHAEA